MTPSPRACVNGLMQGSNRQEKMRLKHRSMTLHDRIAELEVENAALREQVTVLGLDI
jgi:hypothetical protein